jgi:hypothetical protein
VARIAVAVTVVVIAGVFAAVAVSVVDVRRNLDERVNRSFDATASRVAGTAAADPAGCIRQRLYYYYCGVDVALPKRPSDSVHWRLVLRDDGCWSATVVPPYPDRAALGRLASKIGPLKACGV